MRKLIYLFALFLLFGGISDSVIVEVPEAVGGMIIQKVASEGGTSALYDLATEIYDFDNDGTAEIDSDHDLTDNGTVTFSSADKQQGTHSADFNGSDEYFTLTDGAGAGNDFDVGTGVDYSIAFWVKYDNLSSNGSLAAKFTSGDGWRILSHWITGGDYAFKISHSDAWANSEAMITTALSDGTWYHVVISHDVSAATEMTMWVSTASGSFGDTVNAETLNMDVDPDVTSSSLYLGAIDSSHFYDGHLDEFVFFNGTALTATQAGYIYAKDSTNWR